jgi:hypothetical protein
MNESSITQKVVVALRRQGCICFKIHGHQMQEPGWPDMYVAHSKFPHGGIWIEAKGAGTKLERLQKFKIEELLERNVGAYVLRYSNCEEYHDVQCFQFENTQGTITDLIYFKKGDWQSCAIKIIECLIIQEEHRCARDDS